MKVTFIVPCVGRQRPGAPYIRSWSMEPLAVAMLASRTPPDIERVFCDDRFDAIPYDKPTDLVALTVETYTARRAYQIADRFRRRGVRVVMGGFHSSLAPDDAAPHADAVVVGEAEDLWPVVLADARARRLRPLYRAAERPSLAGLQPDRSIYAGKPYLPVSLVETARGCPHACEFCSISPFYGRSWAPRPIADVVAELHDLRHRSVFFTDDNLTADPERARDLLRAVAPLNLRWAAQVGLDAARDDALLDRMRSSGCVFVLIGFESLDRGRLAAMGKNVNLTADPDEAVRRFSREGIGVYATFVFGYDGDSAASFAHAAEFAARHGCFFAAFNHVIPFPGTPLFGRLRREGRLPDPRWWLSPDYRFGQAVFHSRGLSASDLTRLSYEYRRNFYRAGSVLRRARNWRANCRTWDRALIYFALNLLSGREVTRRQNWPLGLPEALP